MKILALIEVNEIPDELEGWPISEWGTAGIALITQDGDGGANNVIATAEYFGDHRAHLLLNLRDMDCEGCR